MRASFRQSMALVHTWGGLLVGWLLYFIFLTGTIGYVHHEIDRWMKPEQPMASSTPTASTLLPKALDRLAREAGAVQNWYIFLPTASRSGEFSVGWRVWPTGDRRLGKFTRQSLDPSTGEAFSGTIRETGGGHTLYAMHYRLHYMPYDWAIRIVGICTMFMLVAIISGVIVHRRLFRDFFTFRPGKGHRSWLDGHNLLGVSALPFHLMITWSGLIFFMFTYNPFAVDALFPKGETRDRFYAETSGQVKISPGVKAPTAEMVSLEIVLTSFEERWGGGEIALVRIESPGRANSQIHFYARQSGIRRVATTLSFDGVTGDFLSAGPTAGTAAGRFEQVMLGLHEGLFAGPFLRFLYVLAGLSGTAMIATGLLLWSKKRNAKLAENEPARFGRAAVDVLNLGTIIGLPVGVAAYFWANRLLPIGMGNRAAWEVHVMFLTWGLTYIYAIWRPRDRAWIELCGFAAAAYGLLPVLSALTTDRGLIGSILDKDWIFVGFDLSTLAAALFFGLVVCVIRRGRKPPDVRRVTDASTASRNKAVSRR